MYVDVRNAEAPRANPQPRRSRRSGARVSEGPGLARPQSKTRRVMSMSIKFTDTQLVLLSAAAQREERCLVASPTLKGGAAQKVASKPISAGFCKRGQGEKRRSDLATGRGVRRVLRAQAHRRGRQSDRGR